MCRTRGITLAGLLAVLLAVPPNAGAVADHLKCYKVKDTLKLTGTADLDTSQYGIDPTCTISKTSLFCVAGSKTNVAVTDKSTGNPITPLPVSGPQPGDRICYKIKCPLGPTVVTESVTDQFGTRTLAKFKKSLVCTPAFEGSARYVDNGDGTVTDNYTGLQWEQKDTNSDPSNPHYAYAAYSWSSSGTAADGTAYADFLSQLNTCTSADGAIVTPSFAGHCDWRLPTIAELKAIVDPSQGFCGGGGGACIDPVFGSTSSFVYWSSTTATSPNDAWTVYFSNGTVNFADKDAFLGVVRAVRGGS